jgi:hypothetical protein
MDAPPVCVGDSDVTAKASAVIALVLGVIMAVITIFSPMSPETRLMLGILSILCITFAFVILKLRCDCNVCILPMEKNTHPGHPGGSSDGLPGLSGDSSSDSD